MQCPLAPFAVRPRALKPTVYSSLPTRSDARIAVLRASSTLALAHTPVDHSCPGRTTLHAHAKSVGGSHPARVDRPPPLLPTVERAVHVRKRTCATLLSRPTPSTPCNATAIATPPKSSP